MNKPIVLIMAMEKEALPIIKHYDFIFKNPPWSKDYPFKTYFKKINENNIYLVLLGNDKKSKLNHIGTTIASFATSIIIEYLKPRLIINAGTAGGFHFQNAQIADVYIGYPEAVFHDHRIPLGKYLDYGEGHFKFHESSLKIAKKIKCKTGVISSGNSLDCSSTDMKIMKKLNASVKEMECASIAWICSITKTRFLAVKSITDFVDSKHPTSEQFIKNLNAASLSLKKSLTALLNLKNI